MFIKVVFAFLLTLGVVTVTSSWLGVRVVLALPPFAIVVIKAVRVVAAGVTVSLHNCLCKYIQAFMHH